MCHADPAPNTYQWIPDYEHPWPVFNTEHQCINWDKFHAWALEHSFDGFDQNLISNPDYHPDLRTYQEFRTYIIEKLILIASPYEFKMDESNMPLFDQPLEESTVYKHEKQMVNLKS